MGRGVRIVGDLCVYGVGTHFLVQLDPVSPYAVPLTADDEEHLQCCIDDEKILKATECFKLLVALRLWKSQPFHERVRLDVRADNVAAFTLVLEAQRLKPGGDTSFRLETRQVLPPRSPMS